MAKLVINSEKCDLCGECIDACPFGAMEIKEGKIEISAACKMCKICLKKCPNKAIILADESRETTDKHRWKGILVFVEHNEGEIHPVTFELISKAKELASKIDQSVHCIFIGYKIYDKAKILVNYGIDDVYVYDHEEFRYYRSDLYSDVFEKCINNIKPAIILIGATSIGRSLAPRLSIRFRTGLTADCTVLDVKENGDLIQIRPAFGGNIMAQIVTPYNRPQFATVRYKVMGSAKPIENPKGKILKCKFSENKIRSKIEILEIVQQEKEISISEAEIIVAGGRGLKNKEDLGMLDKLASMLGGQLAVTRPLIEAGWAPYTKQIGLSGRTVRPRLMITCGISGAVQFTACMNASQCIIAINKDENAPIFKVAHYGIVGDLYEIVPELCNRIAVRQQKLIGNVKQGKDEIHGS